MKNVNDEVIKLGLENIDFCWRSKLFIGAKFKIGKAEKLYEAVITSAAFDGIPVG